MISLVLFVAMAAAAQTWVRSRRDLAMSAPQHPSGWQVEFQVPSRWEFVGELADSLGAEVRVYRWMDNELRVRRQAADAEVTAEDACRVVLKQHAEQHSLESFHRQQVQAVSIAGQQGATVEGRLRMPGWPEHEIKVLVAALTLKTPAGGHDVYTVDVFAFGKRRGSNSAAWRAVVDSMKTAGGGV